MNQKWQGAFHPDILFFCVTILFIIYAGWQIIRRRIPAKASEPCWFRMPLRADRPYILLLCMAVFVLIFMLVYQDGGIHSHYQLAGIFNVILLLQWVKGILMNRVMVQQRQRTTIGKRIMQIGTAVIILILICAYFFIPSFHQKLDEIIKLFAGGDATVIKDFIHSCGIYAAAVSFLLMMFQSVMAPLPAFLLTFANASLFGWRQGAILSWSSAMAGAALCFYISRIFGREAAEKFTTKTGLREIDVFFEKYGAYSIVIARLLPFISFDIVSYAAGLTSMRFIPFFIATGLGQLPATVVYSYVGGMLTGGTKMFVTALMILFALFFLAYMLRLIMKERMIKQNDET
jgi:uncharacterized membrane protein YdjX (TVP38/TMEM64 family)